jgi:hypothetical protein
MKGGRRGRVKDGGKRGRVIDTQNIVRIMSKICMETYFVEISTAFAAQRPAMVA